jgi:hypothetical protein
LKVGVHPEPAGSGGDHDLYELERRHGPLPDTPRAKSGGGGPHVYFENPNRRTTNKISGGVDVRDRAYAIAPRSLHTSGNRYDWEIGLDELPLAALPEAWVPLVARKASDANYRHGGPIPKGCRNDTLTRIAGGFRRYGASV